MGGHKLNVKNIKKHFENIPHWLFRIKWEIKRVLWFCVGLDIEPSLVKNPLLDWPRNYLCVCGSGSKFKKCCLNDLQTRITINDAVIVNNKLSKYRI